MWKFVSGISLCSNASKTTLQSVQYSSSCDLKKVVVVSKMTRYELEKHNSQLNDNQLKRMLKQRGSDYDSMIKYHNLQKQYEKFVISALEKMSIETRVVNRLNYRSSDVDWSDAVVPVGGDGTFLLAASHVSNNTKPVIGFNSDPVRSEGFLCLPKKYSQQVESAFRRILEGKFSWLFRSRIRVTLKGINVSQPPIQLGEKKIFDSIDRKLTGDDDKEGEKTFEVKISPFRALNEVFIGECLSARVSYFELHFTDQPVTRVKSSGLCVCTGTGSTSWHFSMNRLNSQDVQRVLEIASIPLSSDSIDDIVTRCNKSLTFKPDDTQMVYTIRDLISAEVWPDPPGLPSRGFVDRMLVRSKCVDAGLVIDGGLLYKFNDGTTADLEVHPEDALRTIVLTD